MTYRATTLEYALTRLKAYGFDKIELCTALDWIPHVDLINLTQAQLDRIVAMTKRIGVEIVAVNVSGSHGLETDSNNFRNDGFTILNNACKLASALNAKFVTIACDFFAEGVEVKSRMKAAAEYNKIAYDIAQHYGVILSVEAPHKNSLSETAELAKKYWSYHDEKVRCTFDGAHLIYADGDAVNEVENFIDRIIHIHLRDSIKGNSLLRYGQGNYDFQAFIDKLNSLGYEGYFSMEYPGDTEEECEDKITESLKFFENIKF